MKKIVPVFLLLPFLSEPALAQDAASHTGARIEVIAGVDLQRQRLPGQADTGSGFLYGVQAGYDFDAGGIIAGVEAEFTDSTAQTFFTGVLAPGDSLSTVAGRDIYLGARVGTQLTSSTIIYAKGGYTNTRFQGTFASQVAPSRGSEVEHGFRVGAGGEVALAGRTYLKAEYRFSNYGSPGNRLQRHQLLGGVGLRF